MATPAKKKRTLVDFFTSPAPKKTSVEEKDKVDENNNNSKSVPSQNVQSEIELVSDTDKSQSVPDASCKKIESRSFQKLWLKNFNWLSFDEKNNTMSCTLCIKHKKNNTLTSGKCNNFKTSTLTRHADSKDHKESVVSDSMKGTLEKAVEHSFDSKERAVLKAMQVAFWMCKEDISISKFESLLSLLETLDCPDILSLQTGQSVTYRSNKSATEFIESIAFSVRNSVLEKIEKSPYISLLCDESTDIGVKKKLSVYVRVIDLATFHPETVFVCNKEVESGTGKGIFEALCSMEELKDIPKEKIMGLGTDGAKVMTGLGKGLTGYMTRENPMMLNYHCVAHRLALVTSQAADEVSYLVDYQTILTGIFYFFKSSAKRTHELHEVEKVLNEPQLKVKEVHEVRWMSVFLAVQTVYKILDSLITFFNQDKDAKAKGFAKKLIQHDFISSTYLLMDILPIVTELCLLFQKKDIDVSLVKVSVETCRRELEKLKSESGSHMKKLENDDLTIEKGKVVFKHNHIVQGRSNIDSIKAKFISAILKKLDERFPQDDSNIMYSFSTLAMRPISFCSKADLETWGDNQIELLIKQYGNSKESIAFEDQPAKTCEAVIDASKTREEWSQLKPLVVQEGFPRDKMSTLWHLINSNYGDKFPNLIKLASLGLIAPIHTSDCERGFSVQNQIKTSMRNRIGSQTVDNLMMIKIQGGDLKHFDFSNALKLWREKQRKIFSVK